MIFKKRYLLTIFIVIILQIALYTNNKQSSSFRYFKWTFQEVSVGKLISISFFSGLFISTLLNISYIKDKKNNDEDIEDNFEISNNNEDIKSNVEMPPQRDIRDAQPTISVNYRVIKSNEENEMQKDQNYSNKSNYIDDWDNDEIDW